MEKEPCRETSFPRGGAALRQVTRGGGAPGLACAEPWLGAGDTAVQGSRLLARPGGLAITGEVGAGWLL